MAPVASWTGAQPPGLSGVLCDRSGCKGTCQQSSTRAALFGRFCLVLPSKHSLPSWRQPPTGCVAQGYMAAMDLGPEARYKDVRTS